MNDSARFGRVKVQEGEEKKDEEEMAKILKWHDGICVGIYHGNGFRNRENCGESGRGIYVEKYCVY